MCLVGQITDAILVGNYSIARSKVQLQKESLNTSCCEV